MFAALHPLQRNVLAIDRKSTRLNSSHVKISYAVFCLKKKKQEQGGNRNEERKCRYKLPPNHNMRSTPYRLHRSALSPPTAHPSTVPSFFFFNDTATTEIYTLSLHDALPIWGAAAGVAIITGPVLGGILVQHLRSEEHTSELQSRENLVCRLLLEKKKKE